MPNTSSGKKSSTQSGETPRSYPGIDRTEPILYRLSVRYRISDEGGSRNPAVEIAPMDIYDETRQRDNLLAVLQAMEKTGVTDKDRRARIMVYMHFWEDLTLAEIGDEFGVSRERVRQIIDAVLAKLRKILER